MDVLLDEGVPHKLRRTLQEGSPENNYVTAQRIGLTGNSPEFKNLNSAQKDSKLLSEAKAHGFDAVVTIDKTMQVEQNNKTPINVVVLNVGSGNQQTFDNIQPMIPELNRKLGEIDAGIRRGELPTFTTINAPSPEHAETTGQQSPKPEVSQVPPSTAKESESLPAPTPADNPFRRSGPSSEQQPGQDQPDNPYRRTPPGGSGRKH